MSYGLVGLVVDFDGIAVGSLVDGLTEGVLVEGEYDGDLVVGAGLEGLIVDVDGLLVEGENVGDFVGDLKSKINNK